MSPNSLEFGLIFTCKKFIFKKRLHIGNDYNIMYLYLLNSLNEVSAYPEIKEPENGYLKKRK